MGAGRQYGLLFVLPAIIVLALLIVYPIAYTGLLSITDDQGNYVGAANYATIVGARVTATGHTDTSGPADYNMALSLRRANAVKDALVGNGVSPAAISVSGKGEEGLLVATPDQTKMESNRRVQVVVQ